MIAPSELAAVADRLAAALPTAAQWQDAGRLAGPPARAVGAYLAPTGELVFFHNLGGAAVPSRAEVTAVITALDAHAAALCAASPALAALAAGRAIACEVVVWSGPMDLTLARKCGEILTIEPWLAAT